MQLEKEVVSGIIQGVFTLVAAIITTVAGIAAAYYLTFKNDSERHRLEKAQAFRELFNNFNERFDKLNKRLNKVVEISARYDKTSAAEAFNSLSRKQKAAVQDYLNLCTEEYYWSRKEGNIIDSIVWEAWEAGIKDYLNAVAIWYYFKDQREHSISSYYGFFSVNWVIEKLNS
ncbi:hypothetical protein [Hymenobacter ruricola]|uniref:DUF4760 domain-containing protein n=1 Tax=Hymenobacter ruricola TaxID=2791023 RepID=A0ABS0I1K3_9BACT|nr:hypothetical protein [Hymenobacter ruricola]MBF9220618.1 hypothetical protein [Hymenobacter ruricola]